MLDAMSRSTPSLLVLARPAFVFLFALLLFSSSSSNGASATSTIDVINNCPYPIWPGVQSNAGSVTPEISGFYLFPGAAFPVHTPYSWSGRIWARTMCAVDPTTSNFSCATGSCASGAVSCNGFGPKPPVSLAQFNLGILAEDDMDYYDISLADGFNVPLKVAPMGFGEKSSDCKATQCDDEKCLLDNKSPHVCPTTETPSFKLVFCPVPVPDAMTTPSNNNTSTGNVTRNMPDVLPPVVYVAPSPPPMPRINNTAGNHPSTNMTISSAPAPAPAGGGSSSSNDTNHKDVPEINITLNFTTISAPAPAPASASASAPAPTPVSLGRKGFVPVSSAAVSASTASLLLSGTGLLVALLSLV